MLPPPLSTPRPQRRASGLVQQGGTANSLRSPLTFGVGRKMMSETLQPSLFPITARFTVTDEVARASEAVLRDIVMPKWVQIALPVAAFLQLFVQLPKVMMGAGSLWLPLSLFVFIGGIYGLMFWLGHRKKNKARAAILGKEVVIQFFDDGFELGEPPTAQRIGYSSIVRAGRDARGLVIVVGRAGGLFVPTRAFASPAQRDAFFSHLRSALKKK
ncbi:MAG TPA: YcxB family protein [Opitutaceae bacterium]|nr:YcxB family protein [Opitutaceae bacterium]